MLNAPFDMHALFDPKLNNFTELAPQLYAFQRSHNPVFKDYINLVSAASGAHNFCFLPIRFFKEKELKTGSFSSARIFTSSATTGQVPSQHHVADIAWYEQSFRTAFRLFYGDPSEYCILALLPSYLERSGSSLVYMAADLIAASGDPLSGFYLDEFEKLFDTLVRLRRQQKKTILIGVTFALLDFADQYPMDFPELIIMETGGMKGRREELTRNEVHKTLKEAFGVQAVHSEYGMTELLSQAYSAGDGRFICPPWMQVHISDLNDPFRIMPDGKSGAINVIDLANVHSCAFIQTSDIGRRHADGSFEVLGRIDHSDLRGCSLLYF